MIVKTLPGHTATTTPRHDDGTLCGHELTAMGKALDEGCSGCADYITTCVCGKEWTGVNRASLDYLHSLHVRALAGDDELAELAAQAEQAAAARGER